MLADRSLDRILDDAARLLSPRSQRSAAARAFEISSYTCAEALAAAAARAPASHGDAAAATSLRIEAMLLLRGAADLARRARVLAEPPLRLPGALARLGELGLVTLALQLLTQHARSRSIALDGLQMLAELVRSCRDNAAAYRAGGGPRLLQRLVRLHALDSPVIAATCTLRCVAALAKIERGKGSFVRTLQRAAAYVTSGAAFPPLLVGALVLAMTPAAWFVRESEHDRAVPSSMPPAALGARVGIAPADDSYNRAAAVATAAALAAGDWQLDLPPLLDALPQRRRSSIAAAAITARSAAALRVAVEKGQAGGGATARHMRIAVRRRRRASVATLPDVVVQAQAQAQQKQQEQEEHEQQRRRQCGYLTLPPALGRRRASV